jgi:hypothetical protein
MGSIKIAMALTPCVQVKIQIEMALRQTLTATMEIEAYILASQSSVNRTVVEEFRPVNRTASIQAVAANLYAKQQLVADAIMFQLKMGMTVAAELFRSHCEVPLGSILTQKEAAHRSPPTHLH